MYRLYSNSKYCKDIIYAQVHILVQLCFTYHAIEAETLSALFLLDLDKLDKITDINDV
jgi:hypothetical protein